MQLFDVLTIGDAIVDVLVTLPEKGEHFRIDSTKSELDFLLGEKNPVANTSFSLGGNATHVAIGLSRLGYKVALGAEIGTDAFSQKILADLDKEHVGRSVLKQTPGASSTFTVSISAGQDRVTLVHHVERAHELSLDNLQVAWVFLTSMGEKWEDMYTKTADFVQKTGAKLAFNPGSVQLKKGTESFSYLLPLCDVLFVNKEEAEEILYGEVLPPEKKENPESLLFRLQRAGPKIVVLTDGENGSYAIDSSSTVYTQKAFSVVVTEKTGAGDGFVAGFLGATLAGKGIQEALLWGTADAAGVVTKVGGQEGLLTRQELEKKIVV